MEEAHCPEGKEPTMVLFASGPSHGGLTLVKNEDHFSASKQLKGQAAPSIRFYICVEDIEKAFEKVKAAGGEVWA